MPRTLIRFMAIAALSMAWVSAPRAAKLAVFHNGRMLQVQDVRHEGGWYYLTLGKRSRIGVPESLIAEIRDVDGDAKVSLPNVQASAGGSGGAGARPVARAPVARPTASPPGVENNAQEAARSRAEALAARGRTLGGDLQNLRQGALERDRGGRQESTPTGTNLTGDQQAWPSPFRGDAKSRRGRAAVPPPPESDAGAEEAEEEDN